AGVGEKPTAGGSDQSGSRCGGKAGDIAPVGGAGNQHGIQAKSFKLRGNLVKSAHILLLLLAARIQGRCMAYRMAWPRLGGPATGSTASMVSPQSLAPRMSVVHKSPSMAVSSGAASNRAMA